MKQFRFKLEQVLKIKEYRELQAKQHYAELLQKKISLEQENRMLQQTVLGGTTTLFGSLEKGDTISVETLNYSDNYRKSAEIKVRENLREIDDMHDELEDRRLKLKQATIEKKSLEKLKEYDYEKFREEYKKEENKRLDDIAGVLYQFARKEEVDD